MDGHPDRQMTMKFNVNDLRVKPESEKTGPIGNNTRVGIAGKVGG